MKALLLSLVAFLVLAFSSTAGEVKFILITKQTVWADWQSEAGEVEVALSEPSDGYEIWTETGKTYVVPKANAIVLSAEDAALRLVQHRQSLYAEIRELNGLKEEAPETSTQRYYKRKAARDAAAKQAVDRFYEWKLRQFLDRVR